MVKKDKTFCDMYEEWKMNQVQQQQKEYYDSLEKKKWNDMIDKNWGKNVRQEKSEGELWREQVELNEKIMNAQDGYYTDTLNKRAKQEKAWADFLSSEADRFANETISDIDREIESWSERTIREAEEKMDKKKQEFTTNDNGTVNVKNTTTEYDGKTTPSYYIGKHKQITAADVVADFGLSYNVGNAVVYLLRAGKKPNNPYLQDLIKAVHHLNMEIEQHNK